MTPYHPLTSHNGLSAGYVYSTNHDTLPPSDLTQCARILRGGSTRVFSGGHIDIERWLRGTPHVKISPNLNHPPLAEEVRHVSRNADSACPFLPSRQYKKGHAESAFCDACRTSSAPLATCDQTGTNMPPSPKKWGGGGGGSIAKVDIHYDMPIILSNDSLFHFINTTHTIAYTVTHTVAGHKLDIPGLHGCAGQITAIPPHQQSEREPEGRED